MKYLQNQGSVCEIGSKSYRRGGVGFRVKRDKTDRELALTEAG